MNYTNEDEKIRREASVPVQSRIDIRTLAGIYDYFTQRDVDIRTMSQMVSWSMEMLIGTLRANGKVRVEKPSIEASYEFLRKNGLVQRGMEKKAIMAMGYEQIRLEGDDPAEYAPMLQKAIHNNDNWSGGVVDQRPQAQAQLNNAPVARGGSKTPTLDAWKEKQLKESAEKEKERLKEMCTIDENGIVSTPTSGDCSSGPVDEEFYNKCLAEKEEREKKRMKDKVKIKEMEKKEREKAKLLEEKEKLEEKLNGLDESADDSCEIRTRSYSEIVEDRKKKDKVMKKQLKSDITFDKDFMVDEASLNKSTK